MKRYTAQATRSGNWWAISVPELKGVHTQARRLSLVEDMARDAIAGVLDVPLRSFEVEVNVRMPAALESAVADAIERRRTAEEAGQAATSAMQRAARLLVGTGLTVRDAGHVLHVSHQRIGQIVPNGATRKAARIRVAPKATAAVAPTE